MKFFFGILKVTEERSRIRSWIRIQININQRYGFGCRSAPKRHGSPTLAASKEVYHYILTKTCKILNC
jgi:hypothetical protein